MKKFCVGFVVITILCFGFALAGADTIIDTGSSAYWGGAVSPSSYAPYGDVIGSPFFNVDSMTVTRSGNNWTVAIVGPYFANYWNSAVDSGFPSKLGPGDLYINSTGWNATGSGHYATDTFTNSEGWDYVITHGAQGWGLYNLDYDSITMTNISTLTGTNYIYRQAQAWRDGDIGNKIGDATYELPIDGTGLFITFDTGNAIFADAVGLHWTMQCGNDIIEGKVNAPVPEPGTMMLLGSGLVGLAAWGRKKVRK